MMVVYLFTTVFSVSAMAAKKPSGKSAKNDEIETMVSGKWYKAKLTQWYRFKLSKDSIVTFSWKNNSKDKPIGLGIFTDEKEKWVMGISREDVKSATESFAITKGSYYLNVSSNFGGSDVEGLELGKMMINTSNLNDKKNYCPARAVALNRNKKYTCASTPQNQYPIYWFKIKTTKRQKITITSSSSLSCDILSTDFSKYYNTDNYGSNKKITRDTLPAGTYYLRIHHDEPSWNAYISYTKTIWWK